MSDRKLAWLYRRKKLFYRSRLKETKRRLLFRVLLYAPISKPIYDLAGEGLFISDTLFFKKVIGT